MLSEDFCFLTHRESSGPFEAIFYVKIGDSIVVIMKSKLFIPKFFNKKDRKSI